MVQKKFIDLMPIYYEYARTLGCDIHQLTLEDRTRAFVVACISGEKAGSVFDFVTTEFLHYGPDVPAQSSYGVSPLIPFLREVAKIKKEI